MKHATGFLPLLLFFCFVAISAFAQVPQAIPYQAVARNSSGDVIANQSISIRFTIHDATAGGTTVYRETQNAVTNSLGLFALNIGQGTPVTGSFSSIAWDVSAKFLQVEMDVSGGSNFTDMGTQQMMSVPYALYAGSSSHGLPNGNTNGNTLRWNGTSWVIDSTLTNKGTNIGIGNPSPNASAALDVTSTSKGFLMPRMTTAQRNAIVSPVVGLQIFNTDDQCVDIYDGANWIETCGLKVTGLGPPIPGTDAWSQKSNFGGFARTNAVGFSIGSKGYIGTGNNGGSYFPDFWEYDPSNNSWTQKANVPGLRSGAVGFSIGSKGYIGTGAFGSSKLNDFYEYDPVANSWIPRASFPGAARNNAVGFSIGTKGYIGTGNTGLYTPDFYEYDPVANAWTQKSSLSIPRDGAVGFSIGNKGYIGTGRNGFGNLSDFYEYDPLTNAWTGKSSFIGNGRIFASCFTLGGKGYVGTGSTFLGNQADLYAYDPSSNSWISKTHFSGTARIGSVGFSIGNKGYLGTGYDGSVKNDFWEYAPETAANNYTSLSPASPNIVGSGGWIQTGSVIYNSNSGNAGIGTSNPSQKLEVSGTTKTTNFQMTNGAGAGKILQTDASGNATWANTSVLESDPKAGTLSSNKIPRWNNTSLVDGTITDDGTNVGVGTTSPSQKLDVAGTTRTTNFQMTSGAVAGRILQSDASGNASWLPENDPEVGSLPVGFIPKWSGTAFGNSAFFDSGFLLGIGTGTPRGHFDIAGIGDIWLSAGGTNSGTQTIYLPAAIFIAPYDGTNVSYLEARRSDNSGTTSLRLRTLSAGALRDAMQIEGNGNVGIGTTAPTQKLEVAGTIKTTNFQLAAGAGAGRYLICDPIGFAFWGPTTTETDPKVGTLTFNKIPRWGGSSLADGSITDNGTNVGIGTTSPSQQLDVAGTTRTTNFQMTNGAGAGKFLQSDAGGNASWVNVTPIVESDPKVGTLTSGMIPKWDGSTLSDANIYDNGTSVGISMPSGSSIPSTFAVNGSVAIGNNYSSTIAAPTGGMVVEGKVGIGTFNLTQMLEIGGTTKTTGLQVTSGAGMGKILQSDASGNATWVASTSIPVGENDTKVGSLTSNLVPKWNGTTLANGVIYDNGTNIGIGTSAPSQKLEVSGTTKTTNFQMTTNAGAGKVLQSDASGSASWLGLASIETDPKVGSLTTSIIPKWNGTSLTNGMVFDNGSNVGIGTTTPGARLDVSGGSIRTDNQLVSTIATGTAPIAVASTTKVTNLNADLLDGNDGSFYQNINNLTGTFGIAIGSTGTSTAFTPGSIVFAGSSGVYSQNNAKLFWDNTNNRLGIGTTSPADKLSIRGGALSFHSTTNNVPYVGVDFDVITDGLRLMANVGSTSLNNTYVTLVDNTGNLGIGNTFPQNKLNVAGNVAIGATYAGSSTAPVNSIIIEGNTGIGTTTPVNKLDVEGGVAIGATYSGTGVYTAPTNGAIVEGNVGIGTASPVNKLDVAGGTAIGATYSGTTATPANGAIIEGNVGIGTTSPQNKLDVEGGVAIGYAGVSSAPEDGAIIEGKVGVGTNSPVSTLDANGSLGMKSYYGVTAGVLNPDGGASIWIFTGPPFSATVTLPSANSCPNRLFILLNYTITLSISSYVTLANTTSTSFPGDTSLWIISDGVTWNQVK